MNKYKAKKVKFEGYTFDSKKEFKRYLELKLLKRAKENPIILIEPQYKLSIDINKKHVCNYYADFRLTYKDGTIEYEDVKGYKKGQAYSMFRLKKKLVKAVLDLDIIEI